MSTNASLDLLNEVATAFERHMIQFDSPGGQGGGGGLFDMPASCCKLARHAIGGPGVQFGNEEFCVPIYPHEHVS